MSASMARDRSTTTTSATITRGNLTSDSAASSAPATGIPPTKSNCSSDLDREASELANVMNEAIRQLTLKLLAPSLAGEEATVLASGGLCTVAQRNNAEDFEANSDVSLGGCAGGSGNGGGGGDGNETSMGPKLAIPSGALEKSGELDMVVVLAASNPWAFSDGASNTSNGTNASATIITESVSGMLSIAFNSRANQSELEVV